MSEFVSDEMRDAGVRALQSYGSENDPRAVVANIYQAMCEARDKRTRSGDLPPWETFNR